MGRRWTPPRYLWRVVGVRALTVAATLLLGALLACNLSFNPDAAVPTPVRPALLFLAPENNSVIAEGAVIQLAVNARDLSGKGVARVDFNVDGVSIGSQAAPNADGQAEFTAFQVWAAPSPAQGHLITASAFRADNSMVGDAVLTVSVVTLQTTANLPPTVSTPLVASPTVQAPAVSPIPATITPTNTPQITAAPAATTSANTPQVKVTNAFLNIRSGPGTNYQFIGSLKQGDVVTIIGRNADRSWWVVQSDQTRGWIINNPSFIVVIGNTATIPLAAAPPSPIPTLVPPTPLPPLVSTSTPLP